MLTQLTINNFAIVRQLEIELAQGMTVITGETGAGKSIAIDALGTCLGQRTESTMLREGQARAEVCATFHLLPDHPAYQLLQTLELIDEDNPEECIIRRVINADGRSKGFVNGTPVSVGKLKELGQYLVQINGQHSSQLLLKSDYQLQLLDNFCKNHEILTEMHRAFHQWKMRQNQISTFQQKNAENEARKQLLEYQVIELDEFDLKPNEFETLEEEYSRLSNSEELTSLSQSVLALLSENENGCVDSLLYRATQHLDNLCELDGRYQEVQNLLNEALIQVQEATSEIQHLSAYLEQDPALLDAVETRMSQAIQLAKKHNVKPQHLVELHKKLKQELHDLTDFSQSEEELIEQERAAYETLRKTAETLHQRRVQGATALAKKVTESIKQLAMEHAEFSIDVQNDYSKINSNGANNVLFNLRSNLGQSVQPLAKIASGGELSRISLAIQVQALDKSAVPTLIFDEVDVGISGATANVVGKLLRQLSEKSQVICVTHLPQVAAYGHNHFSVEKLTIDEKTETQMTLLSADQRVNALAKLLGGSKITDNALANAREMLSLAS